MRTCDRARPVALPALAAAAAALALGAAAAAACGVCVEDRIAAVYDHAAVRGERARGHAVVFAGIADAGGRRAPDGAERVRRALGSCAGVEPRSVRITTDAAAAAFAFDPAREPLARLLARLGRTLASHGLRLDTLRVLRATAAPRGRDAAVAGRPRGGGSGAPRGRRAGWRRPRPARSGGRRSPTESSRGRQVARSPAR
jgi:hypothetical protein